LISACESQAEETPAISSEDFISPTFTFMNMRTGDKTGERIADHWYFQHSVMRALDTWNPQNGDIFFFRGDMIRNSDRYDAEIYGTVLVMVPLEDDFYWNGVGIYYDGFLYRIMQTEDGLRVFNSGLWSLRGYCIIVQAESTVALPESDLNAEMLSEIHKVKVKRGHFKAAKSRPGQDDSFTPPGLIHKYYKNQGKEIRSPDVDEYIRAEDFIAKTDNTADGYFRSLSDELRIKKVSILGDDPNNANIDCSKVY
jgi:hypothetical protein